MFALLIPGISGAFGFSLQKPEIYILIESLKVSKATIPLEYACLGMSANSHKPRCKSWNIQKNKTLGVISSACLTCLVCSLHPLFPPLRGESKKGLGLSDRTLTIDSFLGKIKVLNFFS